MQSIKARQFKKHVIALAVLSVFAGGAAADGMEDLGRLEGGAYTVALGVCANIVVGYGDQCPGAECIWGDRAFIWTQTASIVSMGTLPGGSYSIASGISSDGSVIVGYSDDNTYSPFAFRWTHAGGMVMDAAYPLASRGFTLLGRQEGAWCTEENTPRSTGLILGLNGFDFASLSDKRAWLRGSVGLEGNYAGGNFSLLLNGATQ